MGVVCGHHLFCQLVKTKFLIAIWDSGSLAMCMAMVYTPGTMVKIVMKDNSQIFLSMAEASKNFRMEIGMKANIKKVRQMVTVSITGLTALTIKVPLWQAYEMESVFGLNLIKINMRVNIL
jgi:hypothetical protein